MNELSEKLQNFEVKTFWKIWYLYLVLELNLVIEESKNTHIDGKRRIYIDI